MGIRLSQKPFCVSLPISPIPAIASHTLTWMGPCGVLERCTYARIVIGPGTPLCTGTLAWLVVQEHTAPVQDLGPFLVLIIERIGP